jgi:hypothetical protein
VGLSGLGCQFGFVMPKCHCTACELFSSAY